MTLYRNEPDPTDGQPAGAPRARPSMGAWDLCQEALAGITARPMRSALTVLGTVLGISTLVITLGIAATAGNQIVGRFDAQSATEVTVTIPSQANPAQVPDVAWGSVQNVSRLNGVNAAAAITEPETAQTAKVRTNDLDDPTTVSDRVLPAVGATAGLPTVLAASIEQGRFFDTGHIVRRDRVAVLGADAAKLLGVTRIDDQPTVFVNDSPFTVIGILGPIGRAAQHSLGSAVILPYTTADDRLSLGQPTAVLIRTDIGAAQLIAKQAPYALSPNDHAQLLVAAPPDPATLRSGVQHDVNALFLVLGLVSMVVGAVGIANVTLVTVMERIGEIGLRRALGAARRHIAWQFLAESSAIGLIGGVLGASIGTITVVAVSIARQWTPVLDMWLTTGAPVVGAVVGLLAGLYPALRAARMEPVDALRSGS